MRSKIKDCKTVEELRKEILPELRKQNELWSDEIKEILKDWKGREQEFAKCCGICNRTLNYWKEGRIPRWRETFIRIGLTAKFNEEKINNLLKRYGYSSLYPKILEDFVCLYVLNNESEDDLINSYKELLDKAKRWQEQAIREDKKIDTDIVYRNAVKEQDELELRKYVEKNAKIFEKAYQKVREYIKKEFAYIYKTEIVNTIAINQGWTASLKSIYSKVNQDKWEPTRSKLISIGFHMAMDLNKINALLKKAYMEPLNGQIIEEAVMIFILQDAKRKHIFKGRGKEEFDYDGLCIHAKRVLDELEEDLPNECKRIFIEVEGIYDDLKE